MTTDEQLTEYHACCTNKMRNTETDLSVVANSKGQVKGVNNLHITDISIFPKMPGYLSVMLISVAAEKIANDIIKQANQ